MRVTARPVVDQLTPARRTKYKGEGYCLGTQVRARTEIGQFTGQIWAEAPTKNWWWVVDSTGHAWLLHQADIEIVGQAREDNDALAA